MSKERSSLCPTKPASGQEITGRRYFEEMEDRQTRRPQVDANPCREKTDTEGGAERCLPRPARFIPLLSRGGGRSQTNTYAFAQLSPTGIPIAGTVFLEPDQLLRLDVD